MINLTVRINHGKRTHLTHHDHSIDNTSTDSISDIENKNTIVTVSNDNASSSTSGKDNFTTTLNPMVYVTKNDLPSSSPSSSSLATEKKDNSKRKRGFFLYFCCFLMAMIIIIGAVAGTSLGGKTNDSTPFPSSPITTYVNNPKIEIMINTTTYGSTFNYTLITDIRCKLMNLTGTTIIYLNNFKDTNNGIVLIDQNSTINNGTCGIDNIPNGNTVTLSPLPQSPVTANFTISFTNPVTETSIMEFINTLYDSTDVDVMGCSTTYLIPPSASSTPSISASASISQSNTRTPSISQSNTPTPSTTSSTGGSASNSPTSSLTPSTSVSQSNTPTPSSSATPSNTPSSSSTRTPSSTPTPTPSVTPQPSNSLKFNVAPNQNGNDGFNGMVTTFCMYQDKLYIGGQFTLLSSGVSANYIASYDGNVYSPIRTNTGTTNGFTFYVNTMYVYQNILYVGGQFISLSDSTSAKYIVAYNGTHWSPLQKGTSNGFGGAVQAMTEYNGKLIIAGSFTSYGDNSPISYITTFDGTSFAPLHSVGLNAGVYALAVYNNALYAGGQFNSLSNGTNAYSIAVFNGYEWGPVIGPTPSGSSTTNGFTANVLSFVVHDNTLFIGTNGQYFRSMITCNSIATWNGTHYGTLKVSGSNVGLSSGSVNALTVYDNKVIIGGSFSKLGDGTTSANNIVTFDTTTNTFKNISSPNYNNGFYSSSVKALIVWNNELIVGGSFTAFADGITPARAMVRYNSSTLTWSRIYDTSNKANGLNGAVTVIYKSSKTGLVYVGGSFTYSYDGSQRLNRIAAYDGNNFISLPCGNTNGFAGISAPYAIIEYQDSLYIMGGIYYLMDGTVIKYIVKYNETSGEWSTVKAGNSIGFSHNPTAAVIFQDKLYIGGAFNTLGDMSTIMYAITAYNGTHWFNLGGSNNNGVGGTVTTLQVYRNNLYIAGIFNALKNGQSANYIVGWTGTSWFNVTSGSKYNGFNAVVYGMTVWRDMLYFCGNFNALGNGTATNYLAKWDEITLSTLGPGGLTINAAPTSFGTYGDSQLYIFGTFSSSGVGSPIANDVLSYDGYNWGVVTSGTGNGLSVSMSAPSTVLTAYTDNTTRRIYFGGSIFYLANSTQVGNFGWLD